MAIEFGLALSTASAAAAGSGHHHARRKRREKPPKALRSADRARSFKQGKGFQLISEIVVGFGLFFIFFYSPCCDFPLLLFFVNS